MLDKLRVDITYKNGTTESYKNIGSIRPLGIKNHNRNMITLLHDLSEEEMEEAGLNSDEDNNWVDIKIDMNLVEKLEVSVHDSNVI